MRKFRERRASFPACESDEGEDDEKKKEKEQRVSGDCQKRKEIRWRRKKLGKKQTLSSAR